MCGDFQSLLLISTKGMNSFKIGQGNVIRNAGQ